MSQGDQRDQGFELVKFRTSMEMKGGPTVRFEASVEIKKEERTQFDGGEGTGPLEAFGAALDKAVSRLYPKLDIAHHFGKRTDLSQGVNADGKSLAMAVEELVGKYNDAVSGKSETADVA